MLIYTFAFSPLLNWKMPKKHTAVPPKLHVIASESSDSSTSTREQNTASPCVVEVHDYVEYGQNQKADPSQFQYLRVLGEG